MSIVYFGATVYPSGISNTGNWQDLTQWYSDVGYVGGKGTPDQPGTLLGRFPNAVTDTVFLYISITSNVATYNAVTGFWSTDHTYTGRIESAMYSPYYSIASDPLAIYSGVFSTNNSWVNISAGTFYNLSTGAIEQVYDNNIVGGTFVSITGKGNVVLSNNGLIGIQTNTFSQFNGQISINLMADHNSNVPLQLGSYSSPIALSVTGAYSIFCNMDIFSKSFSWVNTTMRGLMRVLKTSLGYVDHSTRINNSGTYSPTVTIPITNVSGQYSVNDSAVPNHCGFGSPLGTFSPIIKLSNLPVATSNIGAIIE